MWIQQKADARAPLDELQGRTVGLKFMCHKCHNEVFTDLIGVPRPDPTADTKTQEERFEIEEVKCLNCGMKHQLMIDSTFEGVLFNVTDVAPDEVSYQTAESLNR